METPYGILDVERADAQYDGMVGTARIRGGHHIFRKAGVEEKINLQREGSEAKPYQVRQVRAVILKYRLGGQEP